MSHQRAPDSTASQDGNSFWTPGSPNARLLFTLKDRRPGPAPAPPPASGGTVLGPGVHRAGHVVEAELTVQGGPFIHSFMRLVNVAACRLPHAVRPSSCERRWEGRRSRCPGSGRGNAAGRRAACTGRGPGRLGVGQERKAPRGDLTPQGPEGPEGRVSEGKQRVPGPREGPATRRGCAEAPHPQTRARRPLPAPPSCTMGGSGPEADWAVLGSCPSAHHHGDSLLLESNRVYLLFYFLDAGHMIITKHTTHYVF